jgi:queuine/archaeosine tRNA-ribosyltransferase
LHNLHFYQQLMRDVRDAIGRGTYAAWAAERIVRLTEGGGA